MPAAATPRVSIVTPCYNGERTLAATLDSVLGQTLPDFEHIVVDDGSTDATAAILAAYRERYGGRLVCIRQANAGQTAAKNRALQVARGALVALLDADDLWAPGKLARQVALMDAHPEVALCYTLGDYIDGEGRVTQRYTATPDMRGRCVLRLIVGNDIVASSTMFRREVAVALGGFDAELAACENWDLWTRIADAHPIERIDEPLTSYRQHEGSMTRRLDRMRTSRLAVVAKNEARFRPRGGAFAEQLDRARYEAHAAFGRYYFWNLEMPAARRDLVAAIRLEPTVARNYVLLARTLLGARANALLRAARARATRLPDAAH